MATMTLDQFFALFTEHADQYCITDECLIRVRPDLVRNKECPECVMEHECYLKTGEDLRYTYAGTRLGLSEEEQLSIIRASDNIAWGSQDFMLRTKMLALIQENKL